jgi:1-acyl-sn-glycerol-3-phosphate acyltransferase
MSVIRSIAFYIAFYAGTVLAVVSSLLANKIAPRHVRTICDTGSAWHHWCVTHLLGIAVVESGERPQGNALYAIKHEAFFEAIAMPMLFEYPAGFAKQELFDIPGWGAVAHAYGLVPVARDQGAKTLRTMLKAIRPAVAAGRPIVIFPEGTRVPHGARAPLQSGFAALYKLVNLPVIPVAVDSGPTYHRTWKKRGTIRVHFGEPIPTGLSRDEIEARVSEAINRFNP